MTQNGLLVMVFPDESGYFIMVNNLGEGGLTDTLLHSLGVWCTVTWVEYHGGGNAVYGRRGSTPLSGQETG